MQLADLRIFTEPQQGATYDTLLAVARRTESLGFGAFFRSDHYLKMGDASGLPGPTDAWITLAGLARDTSTIRLGTLVSPVTFRSPGLLAISVAQVDQMSGGRVELGIGAGWYEAEHTAYGFDFPATARAVRQPHRSAGDHRRAVVARRVGETFNYRARRTRSSTRPACPSRPSEPLPIVMGGGGKTQDAARWPRGTPPSSTCRSRRSTVFDAQSGACPRGVRGDRAARGRWCTRRRWWCAPARTRPRSPHGGGHRPRAVDELRENGAPALPRRSPTRCAVARSRRRADLPAGARPRRPRSPRPHRHSTSASQLA